MRPARLLLPLVSALALAGCTADAPQLLAPVGARAAQAASTGRYIVLANSNGFPTEFATRVAAIGGSVESVHAGAGLAVVNGLTSDAAAALASSSGIYDVQADADITLETPLATAEADASVVMNDNASSQLNPATAGRYNWQWNMRLIGANTAWAAGKLGDPGVTVAIIDTGIDYDAPDLNGLVDLSRSTSFVASDNALTTTYFPTRNAISDYNGHGTNVATQVSSKAVALAGVTSKTTLIGVKVLGRTGSGSSSGVLNGVLWAADHGADVANMSLGGGFAKSDSLARRLLPSINRVFNYASKKGMLIVVSAGNAAADLDHNGNNYSTYCDAPHVVCVSSVGPALATSDPNAVSYYTNFGRSAISVAAPGGNADAAHGFTVSAWPWGNDIASWVWSFCSKTRIASLTPAGVPNLTACAAGNRLSGFIGTSQASPHVSGLAAQLVAAQGHGQPQQIKHAIEASAVQFGQSGNDPFYGHGRIDVARALGIQ
jgi:subtilisin family serine protease